jgi:hypothetical protein
MQMLLQENDCCSGPAGDRDVDNEKSYVVCFILARIKIYVMYTSPLSQEQCMLQGSKHCNMIDPGEMSDFIASRNVSLVTLITPFMFTSK